MAMWSEYYLRFPDFEAMVAAWPDVLAGAYTRDRAVDLVGTIYREPAEAGATPEPVAGYHVNLRLRDGATLPPALLPYLIPPPAAPKRVWA